LGDPQAINESDDSSFKGSGANEVAPGVSVQPGGLRFQYARSGGPGGQNVNKLNTKAELWLSVAALQGISADSIERLMLLAGKRLTRQGEIHLVAETNRTQSANRQEILDRLRELLITAMRRPTPRRKTRPSHAARQRRIQEKKRRGEVKGARRRIQE
jgi:ribosome-associated protein